MVVLRIGDEAYRVTNCGYDDPTEHEYKVFAEDYGVFHCTCPAYKYQFDDGEFCKHMEAVDAVLANRGDS